MEKVLRIVSNFHELLANAKIGPLEVRHGVFGPYPENEDRRVINWVAKRLSSLGVAALTGDGYYLPGDPDTLHPLDEISPPIIRELFRDPRIPEYKYFYIFPRLVSKAAFYMNDERGQTHELMGCYEAMIPFVGFIIHDEISRGDEQDCGYLRRRNGYVECVVPEKALCSGKMPRRPFCPFYDSIHVSWLAKQLFLEKQGEHRQNRLIAVRRMEDLDHMLESCVTT